MQEWHFNLDLFTFVNLEAWRFSRGPQRAKILLPACSKPTFSVPFLNSDAWRASSCYLLAINMVSHSGRLLIMSCLRFCNLGLIRPPPVYYLGTVINLV